MMRVPAPWGIVEPVVASTPVRYRLEWQRPGPGRTIGVVMYNPAMEGVLVTGGVSDGATHRRVRGLLADANAIRIANLSPYRTTKPTECRRWERAQVETRTRMLVEQEEALRWACEPDVVVAAWGAGPLIARMVWSRAQVLATASHKLWCWGLTSNGLPLHPSPLGQISTNAELRRYLETQ